MASDSWNEVAIVIGRVRRWIARNGGANAEQTGVQWEDAPASQMRVGDITARGRVEKITRWSADWSGGSLSSVDVTVAGRTYAYRPDVRLPRRAIGAAASERRELQRAATAVNETHAGWPAPGEEYRTGSPQSEFRVALAAYGTTEEGRAELIRRHAAEEDMYLCAEIATALGDVDRTVSDVGTLETFGGPVDGVRKVGREGEFLVFRVEATGEEFRVHRDGAPELTERLGKSTNTPGRDQMPAAATRPGSEPKCGVPKRTGHDRGRPCRHRVAREGDRCPDHPK